MCELCQYNFQGFVAWKSDALICLVCGTTFEWSLWLAPTEVSHNTLTPPKQMKEHFEKEHETLFQIVEFRTGVYAEADYGVMGGGYDD